MSQILIVAPRDEAAKALLQGLERSGYVVFHEESVRSGLDAVVSERFDVVLLDPILPEGDGLAALSDFLHVSSNPEVIVWTSEGTPEAAESAVRGGAWDYLEKNIPVTRLRGIVGRAVQYQKERRHHKHTTLSVDVGIVGDGPAIRECLDAAAQAAASDINVLITGETGTGKELFARAIHENSYRATSHRFVVVDCTALPKTLVESVLFGHEKGAYTGADQTKDGLIMQADGGTLFLDEVGELPIEIQKKFLRVLQEKHFRPIGGKREQKSDFRVIAATHRDLDELVSEGMFREDLLFRLRAMNIILPPLRERREDIKSLALRHMDTLYERYRTEAKEFSSDFFDTLTAYDWPGNVRELYQSLEMAMASAVTDPILFPKDLPAEIRIQVVRKSIEEPPLDISAEAAADEFDWQSDTLPRLQEVRSRVLNKFERVYLRELLRRAGGNVRQACLVSGLSRSRLYALIKKHGLPAIRESVRDQRNATIESSILKSS